MYWFRSGNPIDFLPWLAVSFTWIIGGWLLATHVFSLEKHERLIIGFGVGLTLYLWLTNIMGHWLNPVLTFTLPGLLILFLGIVVAWRAKRPLINKEDLTIIPVLAISACLFAYFLLVQRGLGIFDDRKNLSVISLMANGDIPPHFYMNAAYYHAYHYGSQLLGASLMRLGSMFPWSAFDFGKATYFTLTVILVGLVAKRYLKENWKAVVVALLFIFLSGTRYLLMFLPSRVLESLDPFVQFQGVSQDIGAPYSKALFMDLVIGGDPPNRYPFGFLNGFRHPLIMANAGTWSYAQVLTLIIWLVAARSKHWLSVPILAILFSHLALTWESSYGLLLIAGLFSLAYWLINRSTFNLSSQRYLILAALISVPVSFLQGGTLTELMRNLLSGNQAYLQAELRGIEAGGLFSFQFPPALFSAHLGKLNIFSPQQMILALFDLGPIIYFVPWITSWAWKRFRKGDFVTGLIIISACVSALIFLFFTYDRTRRDIGRFIGHSIMLWNILFLVVLLENKQKQKSFRGIVGWISAILMFVSGVALGISQTSAISQPIISDNLTGLDAAISAMTWGKLPTEDLVMDTRLTWRATALSGNHTIALHQGKTLPAWSKLNSDPDIDGFLDAGYRYIYVDELWWRFLSDEERNALQNECIEVVAEVKDEEQYLFRRLLDLAECYQ
ncbi:MAG TPA: hypothetical protein G4N92_03015 [Anaerolineae bacterium]|nr:hypothetical protein [Anaerolineae bacterium]